MLKFSILIAAAALLTGCGNGADSFFSGRPSEMAMVHNRVIGGGPEAMIELLRVPLRFPAATEPQISSWQESAIAWWRHSEKRQLMITTFEKMSADEKEALQKWARVRHQHLSKEKAQALEDIERASAAAGSPR